VTVTRTRPEWTRAEAVDRGAPGRVARKVASKRITGSGHGRIRTGPNTIRGSTDFEELS